MGCSVKKCKNCPTKMKGCQLTKGMCPSCFMQSELERKEKEKKKP